MNPTANTLKDYLQIGKAAGYLGVSPNTLRNWSRAGKIKSHRNPINGYRLFKMSDLDRILREISESTEKEGHK